MVKSNHIQILRLLFTAASLALLTLTVACGNSTPTSAVTAPTPTVSPNIVDLIAKTTPLCDQAFSASAAVNSGVSQIAPVVVLMQDNPNKWKLLDIGADYPTLSSKVANSTDELKSVVCVKEITNTTQQNSGNPKTILIDWDVRLVQWPDGKLLLQEILKGGPPPKVTSAKPNVTSGYGMGVPPTYKELVDWVFTVTK